MIARGNICITISDKIYQLMQGSSRIMGLKQEKNINVGQMSFYIYIIEYLLAHKLGNAGWLTSYIVNRIYWKGISSRRNIIVANPEHEYILNNYTLHMLINLLPKSKKVQTIIGLPYWETYVEWNRLWKKLTYNYTDGDN